MNELLKKSIELREDGKKREALELAKIYVNNYPEDALGNYHCAWCFDILELEREAVPYYVKAIKRGLSGRELQGAYLGLGSTYRCIGEYERSEEILKKGMEVFPESREMEVFYAMTLYNLGDHRKAMEKLLKVLAETSKDSNIQSYSDAILYYSDKLNKRFI